MELSQLSAVELTKTALESLELEHGGQRYGTMEGTVTVTGSPGGSTQATPPSSAVNTLRTQDNARVFVTTRRSRTGDERYIWWNTTFAVLEGVLDAVGVGGAARGRLSQCLATI